MMIIDVISISVLQQVAWWDSETGESGEGKLVHANGDAKMLYQQLAGPASLTS
jgi:hypothetical protein